MPALQRNQGRVLTYPLPARPKMLTCVKKIAAVGFVVFMLLWIVGVMRAFTLEYPPPPAIVSLSSTDREYQTQSNSNFAHNLKIIPGLALTPLPMVLDKPEVEKIRITEK